MSMIPVRSTKRRKKPAYQLTLSALAAVLALSACGGGGGGGDGDGDDNPPPPVNEPVAPPPVVEQPVAPVTSATPKIACESLVGRAIGAGSIGLPTTGAEIIGAVAVAPTATTTRPYCEVTGVIRPATSSVRNIRFQLNLPTDWNVKAVHVGGSGFGGTVVTGLGSLPFTQSPTTPLSQGFVTFGSDTGHEEGGAGFGADDEALANYGGDHIKKTHDVVLSIINTYYAVAPNRMYFAGGSTGGREALTAVQRFAADYDGAIASAPTHNFTGLRLNGIRIGRAQSAQGGALTVDQRTRVREDSIAACDNLDGVVDGIVSNVEACRARASQTLDELTCSFNQAPNCLSAAQRNTVNVLHTPLELTTYQLARGITRYEGYNVLEGSDLDLGTAPGSLSSTGNAWARGFVAENDQTFDVSTFDPFNPVPYQQRVTELSAITDATNPDLTGFQAQGGKLIMMHGLSDSLVSPNSTIEYYNRVVATMGQPQVDTFLRFYTVPGFDHNGGAFNLSWDPLTALDNWVNTNTPPGTLIGTDRNAQNNGRTRPLCAYPTYPRFTPGGNPAVAASFTCVAPGA